MARRVPMTREEKDMSIVFRNKVIEYQMLTRKNYKTISKELGVGSTYLSSMMNEKVLVNQAMLDKVCAFVEEERKVHVPSSMYLFQGLGKINHKEGCEEDSTNDKELPPEEDYAKTIAMLKDIIRQKDQLIEDQKYLIEYFKSMLNK